LESEFDGVCSILKSFSKLKKSSLLENIVAVYGPKTSKKTQRKQGKKKVEGEGEIREGERRRLLLLE